MTPTLIIIESYYLQFYIWIIQTWGIFIQAPLDYLLACVSKHWPLWITKFNGSINILYTISCFLNKFSSNKLRFVYLCKAHDMASESLQCVDIGRRKVCIFAYKGRVFYPGFQRLSCSSASWAVLWYSLPRENLAWFQTERGWNQAIVFPGPRKENWVTIIMVCIWNCTSSVC